MQKDDICLQVEKLRMVFSEIIYPNSYMQKPGRYACTNQSLS